MTGLKLLLIVMFAAMVLYTIGAVISEGPDLTIHAVDDFTTIGWRGQFNLDFVCYLLLSGLWVAWRHEFSPAGITLGLIATVGGIIFLAIYLLVAISRAEGDIKRLLLGERG